MLNLIRSRNIQGLCLAACFYLASGSAATCLADNGDLSATLQPNKDICLAFPPSMGAAPEYSPEGGLFDVTLTLSPTAGYYIAAPSSGTLQGDGTTIWTCTSGTAGSLSVIGTSQVWEGVGKYKNSWSDMLFAGELVPIVSGGTGGNVPWKASVADISIYVDALGVPHSGDPTGHWSPEISDAEHHAATSDWGGLWLPPSLCTTGTGAATAVPGANLDVTSAYKMLILRLKTQWGGMPGQPDPASVGSVAFTVPSGVWLYHCTTGTSGVSGGTLVAGGSLSSGSLAVPPAGFPNEPFAIVTDNTFTSAGTILATFTWASSLTNSSSGASPSGATASDYAAVYPVLLQVTNVLAYSATGGANGTPGYQSVSGGTLDVKTQITSARPARLPMLAHPARVRLQVAGAPPKVLAKLSLSSGTVNFHSDPGNPMHRALFASAGTVACALQFSGTVAYASTDLSSLTYTGSSAIAWTDLPNTFDVNWDGRDTYESQRYTPNGGRLLLGGNFTLDSVASVSLAGSGNTTVASSATFSPSSGTSSPTSSPYPLAVAMPHSGHYGDDWPRASVYASFRRGGPGVQIYPGASVPRDDPPSEQDPVRMLENYFDPARYGPSWSFEMQFTKPASSSAWFVYTDGFQPLFDARDRNNAYSSTKMEILPLSINGDSGAIERCPRFPSIRAVAAVWEANMSGVGKWKMTWGDNPHFRHGDNITYAGYKSGRTWVYVASGGTVALSFDGSDTSIHRDFTVKVPDAPCLPPGESLRKDVQQVILLFPPVVTQAGVPSYFNAGRSPVDSMFLSANLTTVTSAAYASPGTTATESLACFPGLAPDVRQFTHVTCGTLGSCGVDQNAITCLGVGFLSLAKSNSAPAAVAADLENTLALLTQDGHSWPAHIGFYTTTHPNNCPPPPRNAETYGELYDRNNDLGILAQSGTSVLSLSNTNNVAIVSTISGTGSLNLSDVSFVALPSCECYDAPPCHVPEGAKYGPISCAQALATQGVDVVLSWHGTTYTSNVLFVEYFLRRAYKRSSSGEFLTVQQALEAAYKDLTTDMDATKLHGWYSPIPVWKNHHISGAKGEFYARGTYLYPPRYGDKK